jgi:enoyl-CoA hydratase/carnithine racemase
VFEFPEVVVVTISAYADKYQNLKMSRENGVLEVQFHLDGGPLQWCDSIHEELPGAFRDISQDVENRVVIFTGTGEAFCDSILPGSFKMEPVALSMQVDRIYQDGKDLVLNMLDLKVPVISAINGPVRHHSELVLLCDVVIATESVVFQDRHFERGVPPGDGVNLLFQLLMGVNRGRYYSLLSKEIPASDALNWGMVNEVVPRADLLPPAREIAAYLAERPLLSLRYAKEVQTLEIKRLFRDHLAVGLSLEALAAGYHAWMENARLL